MLESALAQLDSQAEAEAAFLEQQNIASVRAVRAQMVALVRAEHEKECERLENELLAQKDKRTKELKLRLERKKAERAKELMNQKDSPAGELCDLSLIVARSAGFMLLLHVLQFETAIFKPPVFIMTQRAVQLTRTKARPLSPSRWRWPLLVRRWPSRKPSH